METVSVEREVPAEPETVFEWFTDPVMLTRWWPSEAELDVRPGGTFRMFWGGPAVTRRGEYLVVEPGRRLDHSWSWDHDDLPPRLVSITFATSATGTLVHVDHEHATDSEGADYCDGWEYFLGRLRDQIASA